MNKLSPTEYIICNYYTVLHYYPNMPTMLTEIGERHNKVFKVMERIYKHKQQVQNEYTSIRHVRDMQPIPNYRLYIKILDYTVRIIEICKYADADKHLEILKNMRGLNVRHASH